jgi:cell division transport system ATP-binding protein
MNPNSGTPHHPGISLNSNHLAVDSERRGSVLLELKELTKVFDEKLLVLNRISLRMEKGEFLFLVGPNRAGKTTLLRLLAFEERPTKGEIHFDGFDSRGMKKKQIPLLRRKMARVFQDFKLINEMDIFDNVALILKIQCRKRKKIKDEVLGALGMVGLGGKSRLYPPRLSSAERQKVAIARAIAGDPLLLLADEPTSNLDDRSAEEILSLLHQVSLLGTAVLVATSDLRLCQRKPARIVRIEQGRLI